MKKKEYKETGKNIVDYIRIKTQNKDSAKYKFLFSSFPRQNLRIFYSLDSINYKEIIPSKSELMPYLKEAIIVLPKSYNRILFNVEADSLIYTWKGISNHKIFLDSIYLDNAK